MAIAAAQNSVARVVSFSVHRAPFVLFTYAALFVAAILAAANFLEINTDSRGMLSQNLPFQQRTAVLESAFPHLLESVIVVLESKVPDAADAVAEKLSDSLQGAPGIASVLSESTDPFFKTHAPLYLDTATLEAALQRLDGSADLLAALRSDPTAQTLFSSLSVIHNFQASADPATADALERIYGEIASVLTAAAAGEPTALSWQGLMGESTTDETTTRLIQIMPELDYTQLQPAETALASINAAIDGLPPAVGSTTAELVTVRVTGEPVLMFEELEAVADGIGLSLGASMICVIILLIICYRSIRRTLVTLVSIIVALGLALGFASVALGPLNLVSIAFVVPLVGLGLDFAIHVTTRAAELERKGEARGEAYTAAGKGIALALGLSAITTAAAFLSFVGTDFVGMGQVGIIGAVGVLIAFFISLTLVPALATVGRSKAQTTPPSNSAAASAAASHTQGLAGLRKAATAVLVILALASVLMAPHVRFDTDPINLRDPESPSMVALGTLMTNPDTAPYRISLVGSEDEVSAFAEQADGASDVDQVITLSRLIPEDQDSKLNLIEQSYPDIVSRIVGTSQLPTGTTGAMGRLSDTLNSNSTGASADRLQAALTGPASTLDDATLNASLMAYFPQLIDRLVAQADMGRVEASDLPPTLRGQFVTDAGVFRAEAGPVNDLRDPDHRTQFVDELVSVNGKVAGAPLEITRAGQVVSGAMVQATSVAALAVAIMCLLVLRSVRETIAVLLPLVIAGLLVVGAMVLLNLSFNYANVIVLPLIIGLGVDSSIHLAVRKREVESGSVYDTSTPRAVLFSGLTTAVAFVSLALSSHRGTASMGELLGLSIAIVLVTTIVTTPTMLELLTPKRSHD